MNSLMYDELSVVKELNSVEGFDPRRYMRELVSDAQEKQLYLDVKFRKLWFRLKYPFGKITKSIIQLTEQFAIVEAKVYLDKGDPEENYISSALAQRFFNPEDTFGKRYVETAETAAIGRALADAGFGIQFCDIGEESDPAQVDSGIKVGNGQSSVPGTVQPETTSEEQTTKNSKPEENPASPPSKPKETPKQAPKPTYASSTPVEEICKVMTLEDAKKVVVDMGFNKGKTLGMVAMEKPQNLEWYINSYKGPNNILRAGAMVLIQAAANANAS